MNTLREIGEFIGMSPGTRLRSASDLVISPGEQISMREVIRRLPNLPPISLEAEAENTSGEVPFRGVVHLHSSTGVVLETQVGLFRNGQLVGGAFKDTGARAIDTVFEVLEPGSYALEVSRTGVTGTGVTTLRKTFDVQGRAKPAPPPPPPKSPTAKFHFAVINQSGGHFSIAGVTWTVWHQTVNGFTLLSTLDGESVTLPPTANGQYHVHADVAARRLETGLNELAEFRGDARGPGGAVTLVVVLDGTDQSRTFRLVTESQTVDTGGSLITIHNPVVEL